MATIQGVYLALFGRPADPLGLSYFNAVTGNGLNLTAIGNLAATSEYINRFTGQTNVQVINSIYQSLFNRAAELSGLTFFSNALASGTLNINNIAIAIYDGAQGSDLTIRNLREAAANAFTAAIDTAAEVLGYQGTAASAAGAAFIAGVTTTAPTAAAVDAAVLAATSVTTATLALTTTIGETITGTAANETINAVLDAANPAASTSTLNPADVINGGAGIDTMNIVVTTAGPLPSGVTITNVEIININQTAASLTGINASVFTGVQQLWQIDSAAGGGSYQNLTVGAGVAAGFRSAGDLLAVTVTQSAGAIAALAVDGVTSGGTITVAETVAGTVKTIGLTGSVAGAGAITIVGAATLVETLNVGLTSNGTVIYSGGGADALKMVSFADSTGNITFDATANGTALNSVTGGGGRDTFTFSNAANTTATAAISAGAGNDTIIYTNSSGGAAGANTISLGGGADLLIIKGSGNLFAAGSAANLTANLTIVSDFSTAEDAINVGGPGNIFAGLSRVAQNIVNGAPLGPDIFTATTAVAALTPVSQWSTFQFGSDTYIFGNAGAAGLDAGDTLIQLAGVRVTDLSAANLVIA